MQALAPEVSDVVSRTQAREISDLTGHDVVVVGAGAAGGLAADLLCEAGLKVLVLDAGWRDPFWKAPVKRLTSMSLSAMATPDIMKIVPRRLLWKGEQLTRMIGRMRQPVQTRCYAWPSAPEGFVDDKRHPYETPDGRPFDWIRVHGLGGRMVVPLHGRQYLRHGPADFAPADGLTPPWPFAPDDLERWYDLVEGRLGLSGGGDHSPHIPDSVTAHKLPLAPFEQAFAEQIRARHPGYEPIQGRFAAPITPLLAAARTGRLSCRTGAVVRHLQRDGEGRVTGVVFHDRATGSLQSVAAPMVFLCASSLESTRILMTTHAEHGGARKDADTDPLGRNLMDHATIKVQGSAPARDWGEVKDEQGRCIYLPRFDTRNGNQSGRGFGVRVYHSHAAGGRSFFVAVADGEMMPRAENGVRLSGRSDALGIPLLEISCRHGPAELALAPEIGRALRELTELCEVTPDQPIADVLEAPGSTIHECGTARMGDDPATSVLNPVNEVWDMPGVRVTDGSCFPSQGIQNPTLTIMAITARACDDAAKNAGRKG
ncbi:MAG: GMC family oxidoreductase [Hyphomonadaceae bacterium]